MSSLEPFVVNNWTHDSLSSEYRFKLISRRRVSQGEACHIIMGCSRDSAWFREYNAHICYHYPYGWLWVLLDCGISEDVCIPNNLSLVSHVETGYFTCRFCVAVLVLSTGTLRWWYDTIPAFAFYCVLNGYFTGALHIVFSEVLSKISQNHVGLFNGIYGFCFGVSAIVGNIIAAGYINPENMETNITSVAILKEDLDAGVDISELVSAKYQIVTRLGESWFIYAAMFVAFYLPGIYWISYKWSFLDDSEIKPLKEESAECSLVQEKKSTQLPPTESLKLFLTTKSSYFYLSCTVSIGIASLVAADLYKVFGLKVYDDDHFFNTAGTIVPLVGATGRVAWGTSYDYLPEKFIYCFNTFLVSACMLVKSTISPSLSPIKVTISLYRYGLHKAYTVPLYRSGGTNSQQFGNHVLPSTFHQKTVPHMFVLPPPWTGHVWRSGWYTVLHGHHKLHRFIAIVFSIYMYTGNRVQKVFWRMSVLYLTELFVPFLTELLAVCDGRAQFWRRSVLILTKRTT
eukprot:sb/3463924/